MKLLLLALAFTLSHTGAIAICRDDRVGIELLISDATRKKAYDWDAGNVGKPIRLGESDLVIVTEYDSYGNVLRNVRLLYGYYKVDGLANFEVLAYGHFEGNPFDFREYKKEFHESPPYLFFDWDHETGRVHGVYRRKGKENRITHEFPDTWCNWKSFE